jgi:hypothetical protein
MVPGVLPVKPAHRLRTRDLIGMAFTPKPTSSIATYRPTIDGPSLATAFSADSALGATPSPAAALTPPASALRWLDRG